jgi:hypothetical protein
MAEMKQPPINEADSNGFAKESGRWIAVLLVTFALHFTWEMAQGNLFLPMQSMPLWRAAAWCAGATAGDVVITMIAFAAAAMSGGLRWPLVRRPVSPALIFLSVGILITVGYEIYAVSTGRWTYARQMPQLFGVGLSPLLQWIAVPLLEIASFRLIWRRA